MANIEITIEKSLKNDYFFMKEKIFRPKIMDKSLTLNPKNTFGVRMP